MTQSAVSHQLNLLKSNKMVKPYTEQRTILSSERDRKMTILLTPFMSCTAKLPIYSMMVSAFFARKYQAIGMVGSYLFGIFCAILYALIRVMQLIIEKAKGFAKKAFTIIFAA